MPATRTRARGPRTMTARFAGTCRDCRLEILVGDPIVWAKGRGARHTNCEHVAESGERADTRTWKQRYGRCEDAPCCGCCGPNLYGGGWD